MRRVMPAAAAASLAAGMLASCSTGDSPGASSSPEVSQQVSQDPVETPQGTPSSVDGLIHDDTGEVIGEQDPPEWSDDARAAATTAATKAMAMFAKPSRTADAWWAELEPLLTASAAEDYSYVDPANVPAREVTGKARLTDEGSAYIARVVVPTDVGAYTVVLSRTAEGEPWLVERFTPPEGVN